MIPLTPFPEEILESVVWRLARKLGYRTAWDAKKQLLNNERRRPIGILKLAIELPRLNPNALCFEDLLWNHTLFPVEAIFGNRTGNSLDSFLFDPPEISHATLWTPWTKNTANILKACPQCIKQQEETYSQSFWKRNWFLGGGAYCLEHNRPLLISAKGYTWRDAWDFLLMPGDLQWKEYRVLPEEKAIAKSAQAALKTKEFQFIELRNWATLVLKDVISEQRRRLFNYWPGYSPSEPPRYEIVRCKFEDFWGKRLWDLEMANGPHYVGRLNWRQNYFRAQSFHPELPPEELITLAKSQDSEYRYEF